MGQEKEMHRASATLYADWHRHKASYFIYPVRAVVDGRISNRAGDCHMGQITWDAWYHCCLGE